MTTPYSVAYFLPASSHCDSLHAARGKNGINCSLLFCYCRDCLDISFFEVLVIDFKPLCTIIEYVCYFLHGNIPNAEQKRTFTSS